MESSTKYKVTPSEVHKFVYCPRQYFFEHHLPRVVGFRERIRLLFGRIFHFLRSIPSRLRGYTVEERVEAVVGHVRIVGRADALRLRGGAAEVVERKSGRAPRKGAWASDVLQAAMYALSVLRSRGASEAKITIEYRNGSHSYILDDDLTAMALRVIDDLILVKYHGLVPYPRRGPRRCAICPFRSACEELDRSLEAPGELFEPGSWLEGIGLIPPNSPEALGRSSPRQSGHEDRPYI